MWVVGTCEVCCRRGEVKRGTRRCPDCLLTEAEQVFIDRFRMVADEPLGMRALVDAFLVWELPQSVCADQCATMKDYPHKRYGTHLLTATEARMMIAHLMAVATRRSTTNTKGE